MLSSNLSFDYSPHFLIQNGLTALEQASLNGHHKVVELLLRAGANPDLQDKVAMGVYPIKHGILNS